MKKVIILSFILFLIPGFIYTQDAELNFFRQKGISAYAGGLLNIKILIDEEQIGALAVGDRLKFYTSNTGTQTIFFKMGNARTSLDIEIREGGVYYIETKMTMTRLKAELYGKSLGEETFNNSENFSENREIMVVNFHPEMANPESNLNPGEHQQTTHLPVPEQENKSISPNIKLSQKRIALVIGNGDYTHGGYLRNPLNDADDMSQVLDGLGFEVILVKNAGLVQLKKAIDDFGMKLSKYDVGLFYYAGHGLQSKGFNYFIPIDAELQSEAQVEFNCVRTDRLLALMENASNSTNIIILDACRNNPFERSWSRSANGAGLAFMDAPSGSLIAYATSPGTTASDGYGRNGLYTSALLQHIKEPGLSIEEMFKKVRETVSEKSGKAQMPWESTSLLGNFYFVPLEN